MAEWYTPDDTRDLGVGDVVIALGEWPESAPPLHRQWIGRVSYLRDHFIDVTAGDHPRYGWSAFRVRRPTPEELAVFQMSGPTLPQEVPCG